MVSVEILIIKQMRKQINDIVVLVYLFLLIVQSIKSIMQMDSNIKDLKYTQLM